MGRTQGRVKWFNDRIGHGIIECGDGSEVIVYHNAIAVRGISVLKEGDQVEFDCESGPSGPLASRVTVQPPRDRAAVRPNQAMVLILEDDRQLNAALSRLLQLEGYGIQMAHSVAEALEHISQRSPDAAIIDIHLPDDTGIRFAHHLRNCFGKALPIIVLSADDEMDTLSELADAGVTTYLHKPVVAPALTEALAAAIAAIPKRSPNRP